MSKLIQFSAEEINELRSFYSNELAAAEERIMHIRAILAKIGNSVSKRGRKPLSELSDSPTNNTEAPAKKRGRPSKKVKNTANTATVPAEGKKKRGRPAKQKTVQNDAPAVPAKKRGRKPKAVAIASAPAGEIVALINTATATPVVGKKRGRKPSVAKTNELLAATPANVDAKPIVLTKVKAGKVVKSTKAIKVIRADKAVKATKPAKTVKAVKTAKAIKVVKNTKAIAPAKVEKQLIKKEKASKAAVKVAKVKTTPAKVVSAKVKVAKVSPKPAAPKVAASSETADKKLSKKVIYQEFIDKMLGSESRFFTTEEIVNGGIKAFNLKGTEKDSAKNTMQFILNGLQSTSKILRRRKEKDRQAYWAALGTDDAGYLQ